MYAETWSKGERCWVASLLSSLKNNKTTKQNKSGNKAQQFGPQLESMCSFTDGLYCIPRIATREGESGNRALDRPCTKHSFKRKQNLLFVNVKEKENPNITLKGRGEAFQTPLSSKGRNLKMTYILFYP